VVSSTDGSQGGSTGGLLPWLAGLIAAGNAKGWQTFGQSSAWNSNEAGQDIGLPLGTAVPAPAGTVTGITPWKEGESLVTVDTGGGRTVSVGHIFPDVQVGQRLTAGQVLGTSGGAQLAGYSSGPHIEVQTAVNGKLENPVAIIEAQQPDTSIPVVTGAGNVASAVGTTAQHVTQAVGNVASGAGSAAHGAATGVLTGIWGWVLRLILTVLGIVAVMIGLIILFRPDDAKAGNAVKLAALGA